MTVDPGGASVKGFYQDLAAHYHLLFADWDAAVRRQGRILGRLIARLAGPGPKRVLDAACGIGTQAIGLALQGHQVAASDLSPAAVDPCGGGGPAPGCGPVPQDGGYARAVDVRRGL